MYSITTLRQQGRTLVWCFTCKKFVHPITIKSSHDGHNVVYFGVNPKSPLGDVNENSSLSATSTVESDTKHVRNVT